MASISLVLVGLSACGSGISQDEFDALAADRDAATERVSALQSELEALQSELDDTEEQLQAAEEDASEAEAEAEAALEEAREDAEEEIQERVDELDARAEALDEREAGIERAEEIAEKSEFGSGVWEVGVDILPGRYKTDGRTDCYWAKLTNDSDQEIIDNNISDGPQTVTIQDEILFESKGCGTWQRRS